MKLTDINIRDPFILNENGKFCLYGTRARNFGVKVGGFDVYVSDDLENWSDPVCCFDSEKYEMNRDVNWAPEVHKYKGAYYIFATFTQPNGNRATYALKSDSPLGPFAPWSDGPLTPSEWFSLDGTLLIDEGVPYLVFCHEHVQIKDGTVEYLRLSDDLKRAVSETKTIFKGSSPYFIEDKESAERYVTDGPFLYRTKNGALLMIWSTFINGKYAQCLAKSSNAHIDGEFVHLPPLITDDGGHGMVFRDGERLCLTFHTPNQTDYERPVIIELVDTGDGIELKKE